jgi:hypothetical protein
MTRARQIREALQVLAPLPQEFSECQCRVEHAVYIMESTKRGAKAVRSERAATKETGRRYYGALGRLLVASRAHARAGGAIGIPIAHIERTLEWRSKYSRMLPSGAIVQRQAAALARSLLQQLNRRIVTTRGKTWHRLAAILYGDREADLFDYLCELENAIAQRRKPS